jgi:hypothetical protein
MERRASRPLSVERSMVLRARKRIFRATEDVRRTTILDFFKEHHG